MKITIRPEQIIVTTRTPSGWALSGAFAQKIPWSILGQAYVYTASEGDLELLLAQTAAEGWPILDGYLSDRRGLRGFSVGLGAWGCRGTIEVRGLDAWLIETDPELAPEVRAQTGQEALRAVCRRLNDSTVPFRATANRWIGAVYRKVAEPWEPTGRLEALPVDVARMARAAHIGGPIVHVRSSLSPYVSIDRTRAYGSAMMEDLPVGPPVEVQLSGPHGLARWRPNDLQRACGLAEATVTVTEGQALPLLPILRSGVHYDRHQAWYPTGRFRGTWTLMELRDLEDRGEGEVEQLHRVITFEAKPIFRPVINTIRRLEPDLSRHLPAKRLEHLLYGKCSRGLSLGKFGSVSGLRPGLAQDLMDDSTQSRVEGRMQVRAFPLPKGITARNPLLSIHGRMSLEPAAGSMERPDRSAIITARNRVAMARMVRTLSSAVAPNERPGSRIGRIYVDGLDIEALPHQIPALEGATVRRHGPRMQIFRAGALLATAPDGSIEVEGAGLVPPGASPEELRKALEHMTQVDQGPFSGGRIWTGDGEDPRMNGGATSEPLHLEADLVRMLGFGA